MAIIKEFETPQGIPATYHRIVKAELEFDRGVIVIQSAVYYSAGAREGDKRPIWNEYTPIPLSAMDGDIRKSLYDLLKNYYASYLKDGEADVQDTTPTAVVTDPAWYTDPLAQTSNGSQENP